MKIKYLFFSFLLFGVALLAFILFNIPVKDIFAIYRNAKLYYVIAYFCVSSLIMLTLAWKWKIILKSIGYRVRFRRLLEYRFAGYAVNFMMPFAGLLGEPVRAALLTREDVPFKKSFSTILIDKGIEYIINILLFFVGVTILFFVYRYRAKTAFFLVVFAIFGLVAVLLGIISYFRGKPFLRNYFRLLRLHKVPKLKGLERHIYDVEKGVLDFYRHSPRPFLKMVGLNLVLWALMLTEYKLALLILGFDATIVSVFLVLVFVGLSQLLPVPAELGVLEVGQLSVAKILGLQPSFAIALSFLIRFRDLLWAIIGFSIFSYMGFSFIGSLMKKDAVKK